MKRHYLPILAAVSFSFSSFAGSSEHFRWSIKNAHELKTEHNLNNASDLPANERKAIMRQVARLLKPHAKDNGIDSTEALWRIAGSTRIEMVDLNGDGMPEVVLQGYEIRSGCGATGNCPFWIFQKTATGYRLLLDTRGKDGIGGAEMITIRQSSTKGFRDIVLAAHDSASEKSLLVYKFNGSRYVQRECYIADWTDWGSPDRKAKKAPTIAPCPAN